MWMTQAPAFCQTMARAASDGATPLRRLWRHLPSRGGFGSCKIKRLPLRGKPAKRRQRRKKRAGFEEAARLAGPPGTGNRFAATVWLSPQATERCYAFRSKPHPI